MYYNLASAEIALLALTFGAGIAGLALVFGLIYWLFTRF